MASKNSFCPGVRALPGRPREPGWIDELRAEPEVVDAQIDQAIAARELTFGRLSHSSSTRRQCGDTRRRARTCARGSMMPTARTDKRQAEILGRASCRERGGLSER